MKRLHTSKPNPCPVCANHHGCAIREDNLIECLRSTSQKDAPKSYRFIKLLRNGMGGLFAPDSGERPHEPRHDRQQQKKKAASERAKGALAVPERDRAVRKLRRYFGLGSKHRQNLRDRGLSDTQIDSYLAFSVYPDQELPPGIPANLPGVTRRGDKLYAKATGYTCPSFDIEGRVNGWQIRYDNPDEVGGKYHWAVNPHLLSGELPITVCHPVEGVKRPGVRLAEGFLKPYIAAQKTGQATIGSPNGQFAASPEQTLAALKTYCTDNTVIIAPDKGDVRNTQVMRRWADQIEWLQKQGYAVSIEWWGQLTKDAPDIDELTGDEAISYISPDDFLAIAREYGGIKEPQEQGDHPINRDEWELKFGVGTQVLKRLKRLVNWQKSFQGSCKPLPKLVSDSDKIFQDASQRLQVYQDAINQGYKYILDNSAPSLGKSHAAGIALPEAFGTLKLWYLASDHRNPTTKVIELNYADLPVRHNGLKINDSRVTPNGNPFLVHPKPGEEPDTQGNCLRTDLFHKFRAKNLNVEAAATSPICDNCKVALFCKQGIGKNATFRGDRKNALASDRIRSHAEVKFMW
jgi:hypothetical protein